jgi:formylglycine-generating enzyme required for sulfatase activity
MNLFLQSSQILQKMPAAKRRIKGTMTIRKLLLVTTCIGLTMVMCAKKADRQGMSPIHAKGKKCLIGQAGIANAPVLKIVLDHDYYMDRTEITEGFFKQIMRYEPSAFKGDTSRPVESVSFLEAAQFCNVRSAKDGLAPCYNPQSWACDRTKNGYRLPTEDEWEFACRAGNYAPFYWGKKVNPKYCWFKGNSNDSSHAVATTKPNAYGLYDMIGNVWEWCDDRYTPTRDPKSLTHWDLGPKTLRGGSWSSTPDLLGSAVRDGGDPMGKSNGVGFRCVRNN